MPFGLQVFRPNGTTALIDESSLGGTFVEIISVGPLSGFTKTYTNVPPDGLRVLPSILGSHTWTISGTGQATLTISPVAANSRYGTYFLILAKRTIENGFGFNLEINGQRALSSIFRQPVFLGVAAVSSTHAYEDTTPDGYRLRSHAVTPPGSASQNRMMFMVLPSSTEDTWYQLDGLVPPYEASMAGYTQPKTKPGMPAPSTTTGYLMVYTKASSYYLPRILVFALAPPGPSAETWGVRCWNEAGEVTFDSGLDHVYYRQIREDLNYPVQGSVASLSASLSANSAIMVGGYVRTFYTQQSATNFKMDRFTAAVRRNGAALESRLINDTSLMYSSGPAGTFDWGGRLGNTVAEVDAARFGGSGFTLVNLPAPTGTLVNFSGAYIESLDAARLMLRSDGSATSPYSAVPAWRDPIAAGVGSSYWVRVTRVTGSSSSWSGPLDTWVQLNFNVQWGYSSLVQVRSGVYTFEFSTSATGSPVVMTCTDVSFACEPSGSG